MTTAIPAGACDTRRVVIDTDRTIGFMGEALRVYARPLKVRDVEGRRVSFEVEVRDALEVVGRVKHTRFVVDLERQKERLEAKAATLVRLGA